MEHWTTGTLEHWNTGTPEHWNTGTQDHMFLSVVHLIQAWEALLSSPFLFPPPYLCGCYSKFTILHLFNIHSTQYHAVNCVPSQMLPT